MVVPYDIQLIELDLLSSLVAKNKFQTSTLY